MRSVFILYENALFARGLARLLRKEGIKVMGIAMQDKQPLDRIRKMAPDFIFVEATGGKCEPEILLARLLREQPNARVVQLSLEDNSCASYVSRRCTANSIEDLMQSVLSSLMVEQQQNTKTSISSKAGKDG